jgi:hypothetical protein
MKVFLILSILLQCVSSITLACPPCPANSSTSGTGVVTNLPGCRCNDTSNIWNGTACSGTTCASKTVNWGAGCSGTLNPASTGSTSPVTNSASGYSGTASYSCTNGSWSGPSTETCTSSGCPAQTKIWDTNCSGSLAVATNGTTSTVSNNNSGYSGTATFTCNNGTWSAPTQSTCNTGVKGTCAHSSSCNQYTGCSWSISNNTQAECNTINGWIWIPPQGIDCVANKSSCLQSGGSASFAFYTFTCNNGGPSGFTYNTYSSNSPCPNGGNPTYPTSYNVTGNNNPYSSYGCPENWYTYSNCQILFGMCQCN